MYWIVEYDYVFHAIVSFAKFQRLYSGGAFSALQHLSWHVSVSSNFNYLSEKSKAPQSTIIQWGIP